MKEAIEEVQQHIVSTDKKKKKKKKVTALFVIYLHQLPMLMEVQKMLITPCNLLRKRKKRRVNQKPTVL